MFVNLVSQWFGDCAGVAVPVFALPFGAQMLAGFPICVFFFPYLSGFCDSSWNPVPCPFSEQARHSV